MMLLIVITPITIALLGLMPYLITNNPTLLFLLIPSIILATTAALYLWPGGEIYEKANNYMNSI